MNWVARPWRSIVATAGLAFALGWTAPEAQALAVGRITVLSALGQPLRAEVDILSMDAAEAASLRAGVASAEAFRAAGMEYHALLQNLKVTIVRRSDGRTVLELSSERPVNDPFIDLILETSWATGRLQRGYTLLFDPPKLPAPEPAVTTAPRVSPAPVAAPAAAPPASPAPAVVTGPTIQPERKSESAAARKLTVQPGDTAGRIASSNKPAELSLDQMLVAMLRANPDAFIGGNLNRLRAGAVLNLPGAEQVAAIPRGEARQAVIAQSQDFSEFRRKLAATTPATQAASADRQAAGSVKAKVEDKKASAATPDKLTLSKGTTQAAADKAARERQAKESAARVAELSKNIADLTNVKGALAPASAPAVAAVSGAGAAAPAPAAVTAPAAPDPAPAPSPPPAAGPAGTVAQAPAVAPKPAPAPEPTWTDQLLGNPQLLGGGALVLVLLGVAAAMVSRRRKAAAEETGSLLESRLQPESFFKASSHEVDTRAEPAGSSMMYRPSQLDTAGDVDPVAEADVYLAYGRDIQAEEILREAMRSNPTRLAIHVKLLEIFAKRRDLKAFAVLAKEALELSHGEGPEWTAISKLGRQLDPSDSMFQGPGAGAAQAVAAPVAAPPGAVSALQDEVRGKVAAAEKASAAAIDPGPAADVDLDLDAQFAQAQADSGPAAQRSDGRGSTAARASGSMKPEEPSEPSASEVQDLMISLDLDAAAAVPAKAPEPKASAPAATAGMIEFDMGGLSLDLDSPPPVPASARAEVADDAQTTKLALAEEFHAIGDDDGARHLLQEVIAEASGDLKSRAQQALAKLG